MDSHFLNGIGTIFAFVAFVSICIWAYSGKRKRRFDEAARLPFADDDIAAASREADSSGTAPGIPTRSEADRPGDNNGAPEGHQSSRE